MSRLNPQPGALRFSFSEVIQEVRSIQEIAEPFLDGTTTRVFYPLIQTLEHAREALHGRELAISIPRHSPLRTRVSSGEYEPGCGGKHHVVAEITTVWRITPLGPHSAKHRAHRQFEVGGVASTHVSLRHAGPIGLGRELAMWNMEIGDPKSPGCFFHTHIEGVNRKGLFHRGFPVPRLPGILFTLGDCVEFVLAELFQDDWTRHASADTAQMRTWRNIQEQRLSRVFNWMSTEMRKSTGAPWTAIKTGKPPADLFLQA